MIPRIAPLLAALVSFVSLLVPALSVQGAGSIGDDQADAVWGQPDFISRSCRLTPPSATSLCIPGQAALDSAGNLWVADQGDNRVLMYPSGSTTASRVLGQPDFSSNTHNNGGLSATTLNGPLGVAVDGQGTLYVADSQNNRVLVYFNAISKANGAPADLVLGQADFVHNQANGNTGNGSTCPAVASGTVSQCSLDDPVHLSLDQSGDLLIGDQSNNRVLLFAASNFNPTNHVSCAVACYIPASMVWGQYGLFSTNGQNQGHTNGGTTDPCPTNTSGTPSRCTLSAPAQGIADANGNLFIVDTGDHRVLEYDGALNTGMTTYRQAATMVYGQGGSYSSGTINNGGPSASSLDFPYGAALDPVGNLWVADFSNNRVLEFSPAVTTNRGAATTAVSVLGQRGSFTANGQNNGGLDAGSLWAPYAVTFDSAGNAYVVDYYNFRVLEYRQPYPISAWVGLAAGSNPISVHGAGAIGDDQADALWGQPNFMSTSCLNPPTASSLCNPSQAALDTSGNLWVTDTNNNRVLMYPAGSATAGKVLGQPDFNSNSANNGGLGPSSLNSPHGVAIDSQGTLYVADSFNHRVLVYFNAASKGNDAPADLVLGQADFVHNLANGNTGNGSTCPAVATGTVTQCSLQAPTHLSLDQAGDLLVADSINNRVLLFAASNFNPVSHVSCAAVCYIPASVVWGQFGSFSTNGQNQSHTQGTNDPCPTNTTGAPSPCTLYVPTQAIADGNGDLYIVDRGNSRVLEYDGALNTGTTTYRQAATMVYGQDGSYSTGTANTGGLGPSSLSSPYSLALDPGGNLWVADTGNSRVLEFPSPVTTNRTAATSAIGVLGQRGSLTTGDQNNAGVDAGSLNQPTGIIFDAAGNAYLDDYVNTRILEYRQPYPVSARIGLAAGWNLVALPSETSLPYSASRVISQVNGEGGSANVVAVYQNGAYQVYVPGYSSDFSLAPKQGFWVLANAASIWALT